MLTNLTVTEMAAGNVTTLTVALDAAMARNEVARARYLAIYGEEWVPFCGSAKSYAPTTTAHTVR